jgi:redox-sensitive bicupin YhaK (pirin superfamily)
VVRGTVTVNELDLIEGDGLSFMDEGIMHIYNTIESEIIVFDLKP